MKKLLAFLLLGMYVIIQFLPRFIDWLRRFLEKKRGIATGGTKRYLNNYAEDGIRPLSLDEAACFTELGGCIRCNLCDSLCDATRELKHLHGQGPSLIASTLSRNLPDIPKANIYLDSFDDCEQCFACFDICPTGVPIRKIVELMRRFGKLPI